MYQYIEDKLVKKRNRSGNFLIVNEEYTDVLFLQQYIGQNTKLGKITSMRVSEDIHNNKTNRLLLTITTNNSLETKYWLTKEYIEKLFVNETRKATKFVNKLTPYYQTVHYPKKS